MENKEIVKNVRRTEAIPAMPSMFAPLQRSFAQKHCSTLIICMCDDAKGIFGAKIPEEFDFRQ